MSVQYSANVSNVVFDPLDGAGLNRTVAADGLINNEVKFVGPTVSNANGSNVSSSNLAVEISTISNVVRPIVSAVATLTQTQSGEVTTSAGTTVCDMTADEPEATVTEGEYVLTNKGFLVKVLDVTGYVYKLGMAPDGTASVTGGNGLWFTTLDQNAFRGNVEGDYVGILLDADLDGGATTPNRANNTTEAIRTTRTGTAIRAGYLDVLSNDFTTAPTTADDSSDLTITADKAPTSTHRVSYSLGGAPITVTNSN